MKQTAVEWLVEQIKNNVHNTIEEFELIVNQAKAIEEEQKGYSKEEVENLLNRLLYNNMCSHAGDELIEQFKKK